MSYPETAGFKEETTSREAARTVNAGVLRERVMSVLVQGPATADECASEMGESVLAVRPRFSELRALGHIVDTGERRTNLSGRNAIVWRFV